MNTLPPDERGELCISGSGLSGGYINNSQRNEESFIPNPFKEEGRLFKSGDSGYSTADGSFMVVGRIAKQELPETVEQHQHLYRRRDAILEHLRNVGYRPTVATDGKIEFKKEGLWYLMILDADDEQFYQIFKPQFWSLNSDRELQRAYRAANHASSSFKGAKTMVNRKQDNIIAAIESFCHNVEAFNMIFERSLGSLISMVTLFADEMRRLKQEQEQEQKL